MAGMAQLDIQPFPRPSAKGVCSLPNQLSLEVMIRVVFVDRERVLQSKIRESAALRAVPECGVEPLGQTAMVVAVKLKAIAGDSNLLWEPRQGAALAPMMATSSNFDYFAHGCS